MRYGRDELFSGNASLSPWLQKETKGLIPARCLPFNEVSSDESQPISLAHSTNFNILDVQHWDLQIDISQKSKIHLSTYAHKDTLI